LKKIPFPIALLAVVIVAGGIGWALTHSLSASKRSAPKPKASRKGGLAPLPRGWAYIAIARVRKLALHRSPGPGHVTMRLRNPTSIGSPLTLLVHKTRGRWLQTFLPMRPNDSVAWVSRSSVKVVTTSWALGIHLRSHRLIVARDDKVVRRIPIGVGQSVTPTPTGTYFITELLKQPNPNGLYGPYAFGLSAYSGVLQQFGRGGNGQVGIHGTNEPGLVGTDVSHGCIRLRNGDIRWLIKRVPLGTPTRIRHN
jgi:L,D-transpeptidase catalytic domain